MDQVLVDREGIEMAGELTGSVSSHQYRARLEGAMPLPDA
jgi:hypothetical protein